MGVGWAAGPEGPPQSLSSVQAGRLIQGWKSWCSRAQRGPGMVGPHFKGKVWGKWKTNTVSVWLAGSYLCHSRGRSPPAGSWGLSCMGTWKKGWRSLLSLVALVRRQSRASSRLPVSLHHWSLWVKDLGCLCCTPSAQPPSSRGCVTSHSRTAPRQALCDLQGLEEQPTRSRRWLRSADSRFPVLILTLTSFFSLFWLGCSCKVVLLKKLQGENVAYVEFSFSDVLKCCVFSLCTTLEQITSSINEPVLLNTISRHHSKIKLKAERALTADYFVQILTW